MKTLHALLVDDDKQALETMGMILEMDSFKVSTAVSGQQALERLEMAEETPPQVDFLIVDLDMGNLSGIELLTEMGRRGHSLPVMVVTGFASKGTVVELLRQGVSDFLDKPIHLEEFRIRVQRIANEALKRRRDAASAPPPLSATSFRTVSVLDFANLGIPYSLRRLIDPAFSGNLVLASRKPSGYDILLADVSGNDAESFFISALIKSFFDKCRAEDLDGRQFLHRLNQVILEGSLKHREVRALYLRVNRSGRRLEVTPSGFPARILIGLGESNPHLLEFSGASLGIADGHSQSVCEVPYGRGDRIFIYAGKALGDTEGRSHPDGKGSCIGASLLALGSWPLEEMMENVWRGIQQQAGEGWEHEGILLGLELP